MKKRTLIFAITILVIILLFTISATNSPNENVIYDTALFFFRTLSSNIGTSSVSAGA